jgi:hypothetical protein
VVLHESHGRDCCSAHLQVRLASEDGSTRLQHLEETVKRMSGRSALQSDIADLSYQLSNSKRVENMTRANLELAEQQMQEQQAKIAKLECVPPLPCSPCRNAARAAGYIHGGEQRYHCSLVAAMLSCSARQMCQPDPTEPRFPVSTPDAECK